MKNLPVIETQALRVFIVVAEEQNMSSAALRLGITQSAVSQTIRSLENQVGAVLINRNARPLTLTAAGAILSDRGLTLLDNLDDLAAQVAGAAKGVNPSIRLGLVDSFAGTCGASLARALSPRTARLALKTGLTPMLKQQLQRRELDLVVCSEPVESVPAIRCQKIFSERYIALLPEALYSGPISMGALAQLARAAPLIRFDLQSHMGMLIEEIVRASDIKSAPLLQFDTADTLTSMVAIGLGWAITTPLCALQAQHVSSGTRLVKLDDLDAMRTLYMLSRTEQEGAYVGEVLDMCRTIAETELLGRLRGLDGNMADQLVVHR
jgi:DNA-binding transcriptional LysR family regulator